MRFQLNDTGAPCRLLSSVADFAADTEAKHDRSGCRLSGNLLKDPSCAEASTTVCTGNSCQRYDWALGRGCGALGRGCGALGRSAGYWGGGSGHWEGVGGVRRDSSSVRC